MKAIKETRVDKALLRLVDTGKSFVGLAIAGDARGRLLTESGPGCTTRSPKPIQEMSVLPARKTASCVSCRMARADTRQTSENYKVTA
jgi:hypothetical protein